MNWQRGFKRTWYLILGIVWTLACIAGFNSGPAILGEYVVYLLFFSLGWLVLGAALLWVARGFGKSQ